MPVTWLKREVKAVAGTAYAAASGGSRTVIGEEHLLDALLETRTGAEWLAPLTPSVMRTEILPAVSRARQAGGLSATDRSALAGMGVDLFALQEQVGSLGTGEDMQGPMRPGGGWGQRMTDAAAVVLARAEDLTLAAGSRAIGLAELTLALVEVPTLITEHLAARGVTVESVRRHQREGDAR